MATEKRLIDLQKAWKYAQRVYSDPVILHCIKNVLDGTPTVDAVEVVHGRWIEHIEIGAMNNHYECSVCNWKTPFFRIAKDSNYCPNCGAKMDGGAEDGK